VKWIWGPFIDYLWLDCSFRRHDGFEQPIAPQLWSDRTGDGPLIMVVQRGLLLGSFDKVSFIGANLFLHSFSLYRTIRVGAVYRANELEPVDPTSEKVLLSGAKLATAAITTEARVPEEGVAGA